MMAGQFDISGTMGNAAAKGGTAMGQALLCGNLVLPAAAAGPPSLIPGSHFDHITIPGASKSAAAGGVVPMGNSDKFCGGVLGTGVAAGGVVAAASSVCSKSLPFQLRFVTDGGEVTNAAGAGKELNGAMSPHS